jgi:lysozyme
MIQGIDLSHNNDAFNWANLGPNIKFVFLKATQGVSYQDPMFQQNWANAKAHNLIHGAYHFLTFQDSAQNQANNFLSRFQPGNFKLPGVLPPVIDIEDQVPASLNQYILDNPNDSIQLITDFINIIAQETGVEPIIYSYKNFFAEYLKNNSWPQCKIWLASYQLKAPGLPAGYSDFTFWQNSESGTVAGALTGGDVDEDVFNGTQQQLNALANIQ